MPNSRHSVPTRAWLLLLLAGVAGMLFYVDRQSLSVLKTTLKAEQHWTDMQYSWLVTAFMVPYTLCYLVTGQLIDVTSNFRAAFGVSLGQRKDPDHERQKTYDRR